MEGLYDNVGDNAEDGHVLQKEDEEFGDREERKQLQEWRECERLQWTKSSGFDI